jgi:hypothetical protein
VRSFVCCVPFDRGVILCDVCYLFVVSYCKPLPPGKNPFAVNKYYITLFLIGTMRGGVQLGPLGTAATNGLLCHPRVIMMMEKLVE